MEQRLGLQVSEEIAIDIIESIALRLPDADDDDVFELGVFVRANLAMFMAAKSGFGDIHNLLTGWILIAPLGRDQLRRTYCVCRSGMNI